MNLIFSLYLFSTDTEFIQKAVFAGVKGVIIDWESSGKKVRQAFADTQINKDTLEDLKRVRASTNAYVICRINGFETMGSNEIEQAIDAGVDEILLPMVRTVREVEEVLNRVRGRCGLGILVETMAGTELVNELACLPLSRVYVGLNDLAIERNSSNIFAPLIDGTLEKIRSPFQVSFGFGGLTLPECGYPIPCRLLMGEIIRLGCDFSFLRRSFNRDISGRDIGVEIPRILKAIADGWLRTSQVVERDHDELLTKIRALPADWPRRRERVRNYDELKR